MSTDISGSTAPTFEQVEADPRRWRALAVLGLIQFMLVLDMTVVNVALPEIQRDLGFTASGLAWVVNGYVLMAGGLLLMGGRLADIFGRRRMFLLGVGIFAVASVTCGAAGSPEMLVISRFAQGVGEALAAPASLGLIVLLFTDHNERMKALGIWGGIAGLGGTLGTVISGVLTDLASWQWIFYINVPVALFALLIVPRLVDESRMVREHRRLDFTGAFSATAGLVAIVYGLLQAAESHPWGSVQVLLPLLGGIALLGLMILIEARSKEPLIPMRFFANRTRVVANGVTLALAAALFAYFFLLTLFEQNVLEYSALISGLAYLPFGLAMGVGVGFATAMMPRFGVKPLLATGFFGSAVGLLMTSMIDIDSSYAGGILPGMIVLGLSFGLCFPTTANAAMTGVTGQDSSLASGVQNTMQQVGGAIGLAVLVTIALRHIVDQTGAGVAPAVAATEGYVLAFRIGVVLLALAGVVVLTLLGKVKTAPEEPAH